MGYTLRRCDHTTTDPRVGQSNVTSLAAGASQTFSTVVTIPTTLAAGTYFIGAIADFTNTQVELNETNNARTATNTNCREVTDRTVDSVSIMSRVHRKAMLVSVYPELSSSK